MARFGNALDVGLDLVRDMRNHLNGRAEVLAAALFLDHRVVNLTRRNVVCALKILVDETLVMSEIEIGLGAVLCYENLAVLVRIHRACVDVDVGIELLDRNARAAGF